MFRFRVAALAFALAGLGAGTVTAATAGAAAGATAPAVPALTQIRAAHHLGYDRLVFRFSGGVPAQHSARYVSQVIADASGLPVNVAGSARLLVRFSPATGHTEQGLVTYGAARRTYPLPGIIQVVNAGDFESVLSFGVGLARAAPFRMFTLTGPSRVVIDVRTPYRTVPGFAVASPVLAGSGHALGGKASHGAATRTIHVVAQLTTGDELDLGPQGRSAGDEFVFTGRLVSPGAAGRPVGRIGGYCVLTDLQRNAGECTMTAVLPGGQISVQGEQAGIPTPATAANAIVGGTGAFSRARGEVVQRFVTPPIRDLTFRLILRP